jgi:rhodanese-related sulfurtransferase
MHVRTLASMLAFAVAACGGGSAPSPTTPATTATAATNAPAFDRVDGAKAHALVKSGAVLVDVRSPEEFQAQHIDGAINVPADTVATHDFGGKDKPVVLYCRAGHRSEKAAQSLAEQSYTQVHLLGPMSSWDTPAK